MHLYIHHAICVYRTPSSLYCKTHHPLSTLRHTILPSSLYSKAHHPLSTLRHTILPSSLYSKAHHPLSTLRHTILPSSLYSKAHHPLSTLRHTILSQARSLILDWGCSLFLVCGPREYVQLLGGSGGMVPQENFGILDALRSILLPFGTL